MSWETYSRAAPPFSGCGVIILASMSLLNDLDLTCQTLFAYRKWSYFTANLLIYPSESVSRETKRRTWSYRLALPGQVQTGSDPWASCKSSRRRQEHHFHFVLYFSSAVCSFFSFSFKSRMRLTQICVFMSATEGGGGRFVSHTHLNQDLSPAPARLRQQDTPRHTLKHTHWHR